MKLPIKWNGRAARRRRGEEGQAIVEFAVVASFLLIPLLLIMCSVAFGLMAYEQIQQATFAGVQAFSNSEGLTSGGTAVDPCVAAYASVTSVLPASFVRANITYSASFTDGTNTYTAGPTTGTSFSCSSQAANLTAAQKAGIALGTSNPVTLKVTYPYKWFFINLGSGSVGSSQTVAIQ